MKLETAGILSGEREHLVWLVDHQCDLNHREVYADWLEQHGERARATALRATVRFLRTADAAALKKRLPARDAIWSDLIGLDVLRTMAADEVAHFACGEWLAFGTPALALATMPSRLRAEGVTRAWGEPDLPRDVAWPAGRECRFWYDSTPDGVDLDQPCKFNLQLDLSELKPALASRSWVESGVLWVFSFAHFDSGHTGYTLQFGPAQNLARRTHPDGGEANSRTRPHDVHLKEYLAFPEVEAVHSRLSRKAQLAIPLRDWERQFPDHGREVCGLFGPLRNTSGTPEIPSKNWERLLVFKHDPENPILFHVIVERRRAGRGDFSRTRLAWTDVQ